MKILRIPNRLRHIGGSSNFLKHETGSVYVEYSIALMCFLTILFGTMELCSASYTYTVLADAANEGVHFAMLNSSDETGALNTVKTYAASTFHDVSEINVSVTYPDGTATPPNRVAVSVSYQYVPYLNLFMSNPPTMHAYAEGRLVR
jgi:Flp pilus assembly protein TadG